MTEIIQRMGHVVKKEMAEIIKSVKSRIEVFGFCVWPLNPDTANGIPAGFCTIGFTQVGLPEIYVSGIPAHSDEANKLIDKLKTLYEWSRHSQHTINAYSLCKCINDEALENEPAYQWRPIDPTRLMWGQGTTLRYWADSVELTHAVQGIQIVHLDENNLFPMTSTPSQLLLDWIPFGGVLYKPVLEALSDVKVI